MPQHTAPPLERLMDLLHEVRQFSRDLQQSARRNARNCGAATYRATLHALIDGHMQVGDPRQRIVCYASAAELGIQVELPAEQRQQVVTDGLGFGLRALYWAAHRRMLSARPVKSWAGLSAAALAASAKNHAAPAGAVSSLPRP